MIEPPAVDPRYAAGCAAALMIACSNHVYSPPARALPLESMATVGRGRFGVATELAYQRVDPVFGYGVTSGTARFRQGVHDHVDLSLEGNLMHVGGESAAGTDPNIYSLRIGTKYQPGSSLALTAGHGFGLHAAGTYVSPDVGVLMGFENRYVVPFFAARLLASIPVHAHAADVTPAGGQIGGHVETPQTTGAFGTTHGVRVVIPPSFDPKIGVRGSVPFAVGLTHLWDGTESVMVVGLGSGGEVAF